MVINTNIQAQQTANNLNVSQTRLSKSLARLSSGSKIITPSDDAAGLAVSSRLEGQVKRLDAALSNVINAVSFTQTQDGFLKTVDKAFRRMSELSILAQDTTKSTADRALYDQEFTQLKDYISTSSNKDFNSVSLFSTTQIDVTIDSNGATFGIAGINLAAASYSSAIAAGVTLTSTTAAAAALALVQTAVSQIATDRAKLGAVQSRLNFTSEQLTITKENLNSAASFSTSGSRACAPATPRSTSPPSSNAMPGAWSKAWPPDGR